MGKEPIPNPLGLRGIAFMEFSSSQPSSLESLFLEFGFAKSMFHATKHAGLYEQGDIRLITNFEPGSHAAGFEKDHGPCVPGLGLYYEDAKWAFEEAVRRGAKACAQSDYTIKGQPVPAIEGIGGCLFYFLDLHQKKSLFQEMGFLPEKKVQKKREVGFLYIDHFTNNVPQGTMKHWADFYKNVFGFTEVRYFDIRGLKTGLTSFALRSPCGSFCIPINEGTEKDSQINEYLREYKGAGVQHIAFLTKDILSSLRSIEKTGIETLDIDDEYYAEVYNRVPHVSEDRGEIRRLNVLVDGDEEGYLLQIFTKNVIGPIFIEIIQRKNHEAFGEGNFGALFRSIEKDQERRGVLSA